MRSQHDGTDPQTLAAVSDTLDVETDDDAAGFSPADRPWASDDWGTTEREEEAGESLSGRLARELPDGTRDEGDGLGDASDTDGELLDDEVGDDRAGRLADGDAGASDDGGLGDREDELYAEDEGVDGGAASAEEAAVHVVRD
ncbi:DUF5709 domain-containing protein [Modestobacter italicus]|uniref:DUF5709 domain-containing protein n=1 Tax=Modestobacter italicus (strain DSM 44449 / CECT 9708 / BC 501) TaxID=2732864 RepID=UPI001C9716E3|nr:DUF5709 domain-containing protein [Modestobacter italicus]